jgi:hypothetical protein
MVSEPFFIADFVNYLHERGINAKIIIATADGDVLIFDPYEWSIYYTVAQSVKCNTNDMRTPWVWISRNRDYIMKKASMGVYITYWSGVVIPCSLEVRLDCFAKIGFLRDKDIIKKETMRIREKCIGDVR